MNLLNVLALNTETLTGLSWILFSIFFTAFISLRLTRKRHHSSKVKYPHEEQADRKDLNAAEKYLLSKWQWK